MTPDDFTWCVFEYAEEGLPVTMRAISALPEPAVKAAHPLLVVVSWPYAPAAEGMPESDELSEMSGMEDVLLPGLDGTGILAMCRTGNSLRDWLFYVRDEQSFMDALNASLLGQPEFPLEISIADDAEWATLESFLVAFENADEAEDEMDEDDAD